jgi:Pyruvate/2-oxoacid:ferredoxin oxidoreductase delta subunit
MELLTRTEHAKLHGVARGSSHCKNGHEYTPENTIKTATGRRKKNGSFTMKRRCRICYNEYMKKYRLKDSRSQG